METKGTPKKSIEKFIVQTKHLWLMPVILATKEAEIRRLAIRS
jgi:hypothetical protein